MTREEVANWAIGKGWKRGTRPSPRLLFYKNEGEDQYRLVISKLSVRYEVKLHDRWMRLYSGYLKGLSISDEGKLKGLKR